MQKAVWTRYFDTSVSFYIQEFVTITSRNIKIYYDFRLSAHRKLSISQKSCELLNNWKIIMSSLDGNIKICIIIYEENNT